jgi:hypothetical protein
MTLYCECTEMWVLQLLQVAAAASTVANDRCHDAESSQTPLFDRTTRHTCRVDDRNTAFRCSWDHSETAGGVWFRYTSRKRPSNIQVHYHKHVGNSVGEVGSLMSVTGSNPYDSWCHLTTMV